MPVYIITGIVIGGIIGLVAARPRRDSPEGGAPRGRRVLFAAVGAAAGALLAMLAYRFSAAGYPHSEYVVEIQSEAQFGDVVLKSDKPALVDFYATWCGPCRQMAPLVGEIAEETQGRAVVAEVNVDRHGALAERYGVTGIPHFLIVRNGRVVRQFVGMQPKSALLDALLEK